MIKGVKQSMTENNGQVSSTRLTMYATGATILGIYIFHNIVAMVNGGSFVDFPVNSVVVLGIVLTGKVAQKFSESKGS